MTGHTDEGVSRAFILGLDGVPWNLIERWTDAGRLPNFSRLREEGAAGPCESTTPPTTPIAWPSIATGVRADKHGIYGFRGLSREYRHVLHTSDDLKQPPLWEFLSPAVVGNVPMTYPATAIDGTMVAGMMTPEFDDRFTHPSTFKDELLEVVDDYRISLKWGEYADSREEFLEEFDGLVSTRRQLMRLLMDRADDWRLFFFVYTAPDRLQHLFWDEDVLLDHYRELDDVLGEVLTYVDRRDANLYVVSDHGFGPTEKLVHVNRLLEREGYLAEREPSAARGALAELGVGRSDVQRLLERMGIDIDTLLSVLPRFLVDGVAENLPGDNVLYDVDFDRTTAFVHGTGALFVNDTERFEQGTVEPEAVPRVKRDLVDLFEGETDPETGERFLEVEDGDELFPTDEDAPDLVVRGTADYQTRNSLADSVLVPADTTAAGHLSEGILLAWGPSIDAGTRLQDATVYDLAPTLLKSVGEPVPAAADGRVLSELFREGSAAAEAALETRAYARGERAGSSDETDFGDVEERLQGLGYLT